MRNKQCYGLTHLPDSPYPGEPMKITTSLLLWLVLAASVLIPAVAYGRDLGDLSIYDFAKGAVVNITSNRFREVVIDATPKQTSFFTITRLDSQKLVIRERADSGTILSASELPFFVSGYAGRTWIKLSPDHRQAVFYNDATKGLRLITLANQQQRDLRTNIFHSPVDLLLLNWVAPDTVLLLKTEAGTGEKGSSEIMKINVNSGETQTWRRPLEFGGGHALSQSCKSLAVIEEPLGQRVVVLDVSTMEMVKELPPVRIDQFIGNVCWLDDGKRLAIWDANDEVFCYTLSTGEMKRLTPKGGRGHRLCGAVGKYVVLGKESGGETGRRTFALHDVDTGKSIHVKADLNGAVYGIASDTKFLMEVGY